MNLNLFEAPVCFAIVTADLKCVVIQHLKRAKQVVLTPLLTIKTLDAALCWNRNSIQQARETFLAIEAQKYTFFMAAYDPTIQDIAEETKVQIADPPPLTIVQISLTATAQEVA